MNNDNEAVVDLCATAMSVGEDVFAVCQPVLHFTGEFSEFPFASGSSKPFQHHFGKGGLAEHTREVVTLCMRMYDFFKDKYDIDRKELFLAAFFHDLGKLYDYAPADGARDLSLLHKRMIHHISRSAIIWSELSKRDMTIHKKYFDNVLHAILSHHTSRAAGSPVAPKSRVAWMVTLCDNMSARMADADTLDIVKGELKYGMPQNT
jgi:3'-5' exoribonuclease